MFTVDVKQQHYNNDKNVTKVMSEKLSNVFRGSNITVLQIRRGTRNNLGIIFHFTPLKPMLLPIMRTVWPRRFY